MTPTEIITRLRQLQGCTGNPYYIEAIKAAIADYEEKRIGRG